MDNYKFTFWEGFFYHFTHERGFSSHIKCDEDDCDWDTGKIEGFDEFKEACKYYHNEPCPECGTLTPITDEDLKHSDVLIKLIKFVYPFAVAKSAIKYLFNREYREEMRREGERTAVMSLDTAGMREGKEFSDCVEIKETEGES